MDLWRAIWLPTVTSLAASAVVFTLRMLVWPKPGHPFIAFTFDALAYAALYLAFWLCLADGRALIADALKILNRAAPRSVPAAPIVAPAAS
jgi:hypothetical protein